jgi:hypothetical protein
MGLLNLHAFCPLAEPTHGHVLGEQEALDPSAMSTLAELLGDRILVLLMFAGRCGSKPKCEGLHAQGKEHQTSNLKPESGNKN